MRISSKQKLLPIGMGLAILLLVGFISTKLYFSSSKESAFLTKKEALAEFLSLPMRFESNNGQIDSRVKYLTRGQGYTFYFTPQEIVMILQQKSQGKSTSHQGSILKARFVSANSDPLIKGLEEQECKSNYFIGNDPAKWCTHIANYGKVFYQNLYPGIDAAFYGNPQQLEYDILVAPGSNPQTVRLHIEGAKKLFLDESGGLHILANNEQEIQMQKPVVYQTIENQKVFIDGQFALLAHNEIGFAVGPYDKTKQLVIDPVLTYSTYLGGSSDDEGFGIDIDEEGHAYVTGSTASFNFPTEDAFQPILAGPQNAFVTKLNRKGKGLVYSTYLGGNGIEEGHGVVVDKKGNAYVTGHTTSTNFPLKHAFQPFLAGSQNAFITKLNSKGTKLIYSTYLGGSGTDSGRGIAIDKKGRAYITGDTSSPNFPTKHAFQAFLAGASNGFVTKLNAKGTALIYSTYIGGSGKEQPHGIALDKKNHAYIVGQTNSTNYPVTPGAFQTQLGGERDAFVTKFSRDGTFLIYSTYLGGSSVDEGFGIAVDREGSAYVTGFTGSTNFPVTPGAFQTTLAGNQNAFVTKFNPKGSKLVYSTFLGGSTTDLDIGRSVAIDKKGNAYITGFTTSTNFPVTPNAFQAFLAGVQNAFVTKLNAKGSRLIYSTYLGGNNTDIGRHIVVDKKGNAYITGATNSTNFPVTPKAFQTSNAGGNDVFVSKLHIPKDDH